MRYRHLYSVLCLSSCVTLAVTGCGTSAKVTDFDKNTISVSKVSLSESEALKIYDGNGLLTVPLKEVKTVRIVNDITTTYNRELFFRAEIVLKGGPTIGSLKDDEKKAYVAVNYYLTGEVNDGPYRIMLTNVSRLEIGR